MSLRNNQPTKDAKQVSITAKTSIIQIHIKQEAGVSKRQTIPVKQK
jgi:hypothetical protein